MASECINLKIRDASPATSTSSAWFAVGFGACLMLMGLTLTTAKPIHLQLSTSALESHLLKSTAPYAIPAVIEVNGVTSKVAAPSETNWRTHNAGSAARGYGMASRSSHIGSPMLPGIALIAMCLAFFARQLTILTGAQLHPRKAPRSLAMVSVGAEVAPRDDDILPDGISDAVDRASKATVLAIKDGKTRCIAEVNLDNIYDITSGPRFEEPGAAERWLRLNHDFLAFFVADGPYKVAAVFPDKLLASLVRKEFPESTFTTFTLSSFSVEEFAASGANAVVFVAPDADRVDRVCFLADALDPKIPVVLFNPRIGDFNVKKNQSGQKFADQFVTTYSMRYIREAGAIFQCYPGPWKIFCDDPQVPGRYLLTTTVDRRPALWELDYLMSIPEEGEGAKPTLEVEDEEEGSSLVGYSLLYTLSAIPIFIVIGVVVILFVNSMK